MNCRVKNSLQNIFLQIHHSVTMVISICLPKVIWLTEILYLYIINKQSNTQQQSNFFIYSPLNSFFKIRPKGEYQYQNHPPSFYQYSNLYVYYIVKVGNKFLFK